MTPPIFDNFLSLMFEVIKIYFRAVRRSENPSPFFCRNMVGIRDLRETIESGPLCITNLFQNKSVAYF